MTFPLARSSSSPRHSRTPLTWWWLPPPIVHGHATDWDYMTGQPFPGGLARVATIVDSLKALYPGEVVVVDAGDLLQGDPFATYFARVKPRDPNPLIEAMSLTGYDVATPGNHEFDWGLKVMRQAVAGAAFPYVSGNIYTVEGDTLLYPPYVVLRRQGVRVGITGFTTPGVMVWDQGPAQRQAAGCPDSGSGHTNTGAAPPGTDLTVALVHSGMDGPSSYDTTGIGGEHAAASLATLPFRPDLVVVGHSHREMADSVLGGVHFVQPTAIRRQRLGDAHRSGAGGRALAPGQDPERAHLHRAGGPVAPARPAVATLARRGARVDGIGTRQGNRADERRRRPG